LEDQKLKFRERIRSAQSNIGEIIALESRPKVRFGKDNTELNQSK
jgi:hypothetical protein